MIESESITRTSMMSATVFAASDAEAYVAERADDRQMQTTPAQPSEAAWRNAASNAPGDGAAVSGRVDEAATFAQKDSYYQIAAGIAHYSGVPEITGWYETLFSVLPDLNEYIGFFVSNDMAGPGGPLAAAGLVSDPELAVTPAAVTAKTPMGPLV